MTDTTATERKYPVGQHPDLPPPVGTIGVVGWIRHNLFPSAMSSCLTIAALIGLYFLLPPILNWAIFDANFVGTSKDDCTSGGACWVFINVRFNQLVFGFYPSHLYWRPILAFVLLFVALYPLLFDKVPYRKPWICFTIVYPVIAYFLLMGGLGLEEVVSDNLGGFMLTVIIGVAGIVASLPIGVVLALGRRSQMPIVRVLCVCFIEFIRGVPLITVLFMSSVMLPLFLPEGVSFDKLLRVLIGVALFASAYMAEVVRGGLQAIPRGQYEAAQALGLTYWKMMGLVVLPQALKIVIPGIVSNFIGLFKDTTLVSIVGLLDLLGMTKSSVADSKWIGLAHEGYAFAALVFFVCCFSMARYSIYLENRLHTGHKR
jgi:general L-amino acid transport system permease protein